MKCKDCKHLEEDMYANVLGGWNQPYLCRLANRSFRHRNFKCPLEEKE